MAVMQIPLPESTRRLLDPRKTPLQGRHPGLQLDKFIAPPERQEDQREALESVLQTQGDPDLLEALLRRRQAWLAQLKAASFRCVSTGPLTLHLSRASALENAGICLHPLYGFVYLPGTGLKGMARAYAETVAQARDEEIAAVFGDTESAGNIVFHDAWPTQWPRLIVDILNNHHAKYYQEGEPPGDWEDPVPVYFLAVPAPATFAFALSKRRDDTDGRLLSLARQWLEGALCHLGAGAKTNTGYGAFRPAEGQPPAFLSPRHKTFETTLELVTPAFLAGANQQADDCDLRPATLRGLLRWWWRTMHAGFVDVTTLRHMEAAIWGDTERGAAVRLTVETLHTPARFECPGKKFGKNKKAQAILTVDEDFIRRCGIEPAPKFTTQGLLYNAYGTDEMKTGDVDSRKRRWCVDAGSVWRVTIAAQAIHAEAKGPAQTGSASLGFTAEQVLEQAQAALWLLCQFGGVGAKARKGFGSFADPKELSAWSWESVQQCAERFRNRWQALGLPFQQGRCDAPSLSSAKPVCILTSWTNPWFALDQIGASRQAFAQSPKDSGHGKHCASKAALGLPRQIHGPRPFRLPHQASHTPPEELLGPQGKRYAAPVIFHLAKNTDGELSIRILCFEPRQLWAVGHHDCSTGPEVVKKLLNQYMGHLQKDLEARAERTRKLGRAESPSPTTSPATASAPASGKVRVKVLGKHEKLKDAYFVQEEGKQRGILRFGTLPSGQKPPEPNDVLEVYRQNDDPRSPLYRWDPPPPPKGPQQGGGPRRRR